VAFERGKHSSGHGATSARRWSLAPVELGDALVRLHVAIVAEAEDTARPFVTVAETADAVGFLGALADARAVPIRWVVIWLAKSPTVFLGGDEFDGPASNLEIERRWAAAWRAWDTQNDASFSIGAHDLQTRHPVLLLSAEGHAPRPLSAGRDPAPLELCTDDGLLEANELPTFSGSTRRFLVSRPAHGSPKFYELTEGETAQGHAQSVRDLMREHRDRVLFNAGPGLLGAGPIRVTPFHAVPYLDFAAILHGEAPRLAFGGANGLSLPDGANFLRAWEASARHRTRPLDAGRLFGSLDAPELRTLEATYLRVRAVADMIRCVRDAVERSGQPLFNVSPESFVTEIDCLTDGLPFLWQARVRLARPGVARTCTVAADPPIRLFSRPQTTGLDSLVPTEPATAFLAEALLLDVAEVGAGSIALKVQLVPRQAVSVAETDLLRLNLRVGDRQLPILARPIRAMIGRQPFEARTLPFSAPADRPMRAGAQVSVLAETIPLQGSPHDLYAIFILACRMLLAGGHPTALESGKEAEEAATIAALRLAIGADNAREAPSEGLLFARPDAFPPLVLPAPLVASESGTATWPSGIGAGLWSDVLRAIASLRPGWPGCPCRDLAHFDADDPARIFDRPLDAFELLTRQLRTALLGQRAIDAEIRAVALELADASARFSRAK